MEQHMFYAAVLFIPVALLVYKLYKVNEACAIFVAVIFFPIWAPLALCAYILAHCALYLGVVVLLMLGTGLIIILERLCNLL